MKVLRGMCLFLVAIGGLSFSIESRGMASPPAEGCFGGAPKFSLFSRFSDPDSPEVRAVFENVVEILKDFAPEKVDIQVDYKGTEFNAYAFRSGGVASVQLNVGLLLDEQSTEDTVALVACHELGHHFAGAPSWGGLSVEGQSDYYASQQCFENWVRRSKFHPKPSSVASDYCAKALGRHDLECARTHEATLRLGKVASRLGREPKEPLLTEKDPSAVPVTSFRHPKAQCRVDTYKAGFQCLIESKCPTALEYRPKCWYANGI